MKTWRVCVFDRESKCRSQLVQITRAELRIMAFDDPLRAALSSPFRLDKPDVQSSRLRVSCSGKRRAGAFRFHVESVALDVVIAKAKPQNIGCFGPVTTTYSANEYVMQAPVFTVKIRRMRSGRARRSLDAARSRAAFQPRLSRSGVSNSRKLL
jgi:hypothetical protein